MGIFLTGGTGLLGSTLLKTFAQSDDVTCLVRAFSDQITYKQCIGDLANLELLEEQIKRSELVYHFAGIPESFQKKNNIMYETNYIGTKNIVDMCKKYDRFLVYSSSINVLGKRNISSQKIEDWLGVAYESDYNHSKLDAELYIRKHITKNKRAILYPAALYGPGTRNNGINNFIHKIAVRKAPLYPDGFVPLVFARDVAKIARAIGLKQMPSEMVLFDNIISTKDLVVTIQNIMKQRHRLFPIRTPIALFKKIARIDEFIASVSCHSPQVTVQELNFLSWCPKEVLQLNRSNGQTYTEFLEGLAETINSRQGAQ